MFCASPSAPSSIAAPSAPRRSSRWRRGLAVAWAAPVSALGLLLAAIGAASGGSVRRRAGTVEAHGGGIARVLARLPLAGGADALALGHVILGRTQASLDRHRAHEAVHVRQCERWGPLFVPAYLAAGAWARLHGGDPYWDNPFEREAYEATRPTP